MKVIEKRDYEVQLTYEEAQELENVISLLDDLHRTDYFSHFRDEVIGTDGGLNIYSFKNLANLLDNLLEDVTVNTLA